MEYRNAESEQCFAAGRASGAAVPVSIPMACRRARTSPAARASPSHSTGCHSPASRPFWGRCCKRKPAGHSTSASVTGCSLRGLGAALWGSSNAVPAAREIEALDKRPGVYSARYAGPAKDSVENMKKVLREMEGISDRKACFRTVIALIQGKEEHLFEGRVDGKILTAQQGEAGFGYDPIFQPEGFDLSFAEMPMDEKNKISHRGRAIQQLIAFLKEQHNK